MSPAGRISPCSWREVAWAELSIAHREDLIGNPNAQLDKLVLLSLAFWFGRWHSLAIIYYPVLPCILLLNSVLSLVEAEALLAARILLRERHGAEMLMDEQVRGYRPKQRQFYINAQSRET